MNRAWGIPGKFFDRVIAGCRSLHNTYGIRADESVALDPFGITGLGLENCLPVESSKRLKISCTHECVKYPIWNKKGGSWASFC
jgi:hypothetical protein